MVAALVGCPKLFTYKVALNEQGSEAASYGSLTEPYSHALKSLLLLAMQNRDTNPNIQKWQLVKISKETNLKHFK